MCSVWHDYLNNPSVSVTLCNAFAQQLHCIDSDVCFCHSVICIMIHRSVYVSEKTPVEKSAQIMSSWRARSIDDAVKMFVLSECILPVWLKAVVIHLIWATEFNSSHFVSFQHTKYLNNICTNIVFFCGICFFDGDLEVPLLRVQFFSGGGGQLSFTFI